MKEKQLIEALKGWLDTKVLLEAVMPAMAATAHIFPSGSSDIIKVYIYSIGARSGLTIPEVEKAGLEQGRYAWSHVPHGHPGAEDFKAAKPMDSIIPWLVEVLRDYNPSDPILHKVEHTWREKTTYLISAVPADPEKRESYFSNLRADNTVYGDGPFILVPMPTSKERKEYDRMGFKPIASSLSELSWEEVARVMYGSTNPNYVYRLEQANLAPGGGGSTGSGKTLKPGTKISLPTDVAARREWPSRIVAAREKAARAVSSEKAKQARWATDPKARRRAERRKRKKSEEAEEHYKKQWQRMLTGKQSPTPKKKKVEVQRAYEMEPTKQSEDIPYYFEIHIDNLREHTGKNRYESFNNILQAANTPPWLSITPVPEKNSWYFMVEIDEVYSSPTEVGERPERQTWGKPGVPVYKKDPLDVEQVTLRQDTSLKALGSKTSAEFKGKRMEPRTRKYPDRRYNDSENTGFGVYQGRENWDFEELLRALNPDLTFRTEEDPEGLKDPKVYIEIPSPIVVNVPVSLERNWWVGAEPSGAYEDPTAKEEKRKRREKAAEKQLRSVRRFETSPTSSEFRLVKMRQLAEDELNKLANRFNKTPYVIRLAVEEFIKRTNLLYSRGASLEQLSRKQVDGLIKFLKRLNEIDATEMPEEFQKLIEEWTDRVDFLLYE